MRENITSIGGDLDSHVDLRSGTLPNRQLKLSLVTLGNETTHRVGEQVHILAKLEPASVVSELLSRFRVERAMVTIDLAIYKGKEKFHIADPESAILSLAEIETPGVGEPSVFKFSFLPAVGGEHSLRATLRVNNNLISYASLKIAISED